MPVKYITNTEETNTATHFNYRIVYSNDNSMMHSHTYYEVFLVLAPKLIHMINDTYIELERGSLVFIRKQDIHMFKYIPSNDPSIINLAFSEQILNDLFQFLSDGYPSEKLLTSEETPCIVLNETNIQWLLERFNMLNAIDMNDIQKLNYSLRMLLMNIFTKFFRQLYQEDFSTDSKIPAWLRDFIYELSKPENFTQDTDDIIQLSGKSHEYLIRSLKKYYGKTLSQYVNDLRLNYWANLLVNSDAKILDTCLDSGFTNVSWAYTLFKNKYNMSPSRYRKVNM